MSATDKFSVKELIVGVVLLAIVGGAMFYTLSVFNAESVKKVTDITQAGDKESSHVEVHVKLVSIDPIKADATARFEFEPSESLLGQDNTLKQDLKLYLNSSNGKQEIDFVKGKLMSPVEAVFNMHDGQATEYPFDKYASDIDIYIKKVKPAEKKKPETTETRPAADEQGEKKKAEDDADDDEMALSVDFVGSIPGYWITATKANYSETDFVGIDSKIERSGTVKFFSLFVSVLMWALAIGVLFFVCSLVIRGRKIEVSMFSFMSALLFAFYAVRNSQPNIPPIGVFGDFISFFWAEVIIACCLLASVIVWILRPAK